MVGTKNNMDATAQTEKPKETRKGFPSEEAKKKFLANPTRFPTDDEWDDMSPIEQHCFTMSLECD